MRGWQAERRHAKGGRVAPLASYGLTDTLARVLGLVCDNPSVSSSSETAKCRDGVFD